MIRSSHPIRHLSLIITFIIFAITWLMVAGPALAQAEANQEPSMVNRLFGQPDLAAPLVIPMILALGGLLTLMAFLGWVFMRMPENGEA